MADGVYTVTSPTYPGEAVQTAFDEIKENFEWIRRSLMNGCIPPINGAIITYNYNMMGLGELTAIIFSGTLAGSAAFTYSGGNLTVETWTLYGHTIRYTHVYSGNFLDHTTVAVS